jgi:digeranylgeranylglycerophospholipid reductase
MIETDVTIIGGGPIGASVAQKISKKDYKVAIIEKNKEIGQHLQCAGLVTSRIFKHVNINTNEILQNKIKGANIHSPSNHIVTLGGDKTHALVINRQFFDKKLIDKAVDDKTQIFRNEKFIKTIKKDNKLEIKTNKTIFSRSKLLIGADGALSSVRKQYNLPEPEEKLLGIGAEISNTKLDSDFVEIFVGNKVSPGFFAWIIPLNEEGTKARIGLCIKQNCTHPSKYYFNRFLKHKHTKPFFKNIKITKSIGGIIPVGFLKKTFDDNLMIVGDAASQVKPTSGGGLYPGLISADFCAKTAITALENNDFSAKNLSIYQKKWTDMIGKEIRIGMKFRKIFKDLTDEELDFYLKKFENEKIINTINEYGDIDFPSKLVKPLIKKSPSLVRFLPKLLK